MKKTGHSPSRILAALLAAALAVPMPSWAGMIDNEALAAESQSQQADAAQAERARVQAFLERADLKERLQAMGVSGLNAAGRVKALSDAEVHALAQRIDALPAGGNLSNQDLILILLIVLLVAVIV